MLFKNLNYKVVHFSLVKYNIKNITNYLMICLYNNLGNSNIKLQNKTANSTREYERKYPEGFGVCLGLL